MRTKDVFNKIIALLSAEKEEVAFTYARLKDGTIVESPTFDLGEEVEVVSEDGTKTPAPDGEHELALKDESGNENIIRIVTKDGKIVERENVEEKSNEEMKAEDVKVEPLPGESKVIGEDDKKEEKMGAEEELPSGDGVVEETDTMPGEEGSPFDMAAVDKKMEEMSYRIEELEKKLAKMAEVEVEIKEDGEEEEELPKLDGAPVDETKMSAIYKSKNNKTGENTQNKFLSRLYN